MATWTKQFPNGNEECSSIESKTYRGMTGFQILENKPCRVTGWVSEVNLIWF